MRRPMPAGWKAKPAAAPADDEEPAAAPRKLGLLDFAFLAALALAIAGTVVGAPQRMSTALVGVVGTAAPPAASLSQTAPRPCPVQRLVASAA